MSDTRRSREVKGLDRGVSLPTIEQPQKKTFTKNRDYSSLETLDPKTKGKRVTFFVNGDYVRYGIQFPIPRNIRNWNTLLKQVMAATGNYTAKIYTTSGHPLRRLEQLEHGETYVAAGNEPFKPMTYRSSNKDLAHVPTVVEKAGYRKADADYEARMENLASASKAKRIQIFTLNPLTAAVTMVVAPKNLMDFDRFLSTVGGRVSLPHGNGSVERLVDLNGEDIGDCSQIGDDESYLALGSFHYSSSVIQKRLLQIQAVTPRGSDAALHRGSVATAISKNQSIRRRPPHHISKLDRMGTTVTTRSLSQSPTRSPTRTSFARSEPINSDIFAPDAPTRLKPLEEAEKQVLILAQKPSAVEDLWSKLDATSIQMPLGTIKALLRRSHPRLLIELYAWVPAYCEATNRDDGAEPTAYLGKGELRAFLLYLLYFSKGIIALADKTNFDDLEVSFNEFSLLLQLMKVNRSLAQAASAFDFLDHSRTGSVPYTAVCAWVARDVCPRGVRTSQLRDHSVSSAKEWKRIQSAVVEICKNRTKQDELWDLTNFNVLEMIRLADVIEKIHVISPLLTNSACWHVAYEALLLVTQDSQISGYSANVGTQGNLHMWIERGEFQFMIIAAFTACKLHSMWGPKILEVGYTFDVNTFKRSLRECGIEIADSEAELLMQEVDKDKTGSVSFAEFLITVAHQEFNEDFILVPEANMKHSTADLLTNDSSEVDDEDSESVTEKHSLTFHPLKKGFRKAYMKQFSKVEKELRPTILSPERCEELFTHIDSNASGIMSIEEAEHFIDTKYPILGLDKHTLIKALVLTTKHPVRARISESGTVYDPTGDAWITLSQFQDFLTFVIYLSKLYALLSIKGSTTEATVDLPMFYTLLQLTDATVKNSEIRQEYVSLQGASEATKGAILFDDFAKWYCHYELYRGVGKKKEAQRKLRRKLPSATKKKRQLALLRNLLLLEPEIEGFVGDPYLLKSTWARLGPQQPNGRGMTLHDFHASFASLYPDLESEAIALRMCKAVFKRVGSGGIMITEADLLMCVVGLFCFHHVFIETGVDPRSEYSVTEDNFSDLLIGLRIKLDHQSLVRAFTSLESFEFGSARLDDVCLWYITQRFPDVHVQTRKPTPYDGLRNEFSMLATDSKRLYSLFHQLDVEKCGSLSIDVVKDWVSRTYPVLDNSAALMAALRSATGQSAFSITDTAVSVSQAIGTIGVEAKHFRRFVTNLFYFNLLYDTYDVDPSKPERWMTFVDFSRGLTQLGIEVSPELAKVEFSSLCKAPPKKDQRAGLARVDDMGHWVSTHLYPDTIPGAQRAQHARKASLLHSGLTRDGTLTSEMLVPLSSLSQEERLQRFLRLEREMINLCGNEVRLHALWSQLDVNCDGVCTLGRFHDIISGLYPFVRHRKWLAFAYECATGKQTSVARLATITFDFSDLPQMLTYNVYAHMLFASSSNIHLEDGVPLVDVQEFRCLLESVDIDLSYKDVTITFAKLAQHKGGVSLVAVLKWVMSFRQRSTRRLSFQ